MPDNIFQAAWGGGPSWDRRVAQAATVHRVAVREAAEQGRGELLAVLQGLAVAHGPEAALVALEDTTTALKQWLRQREAARR